MDSFWKRMKKWHWILQRWSSFEENEIFMKIELKLNIVALNFFKSHKQTNEQTNKEEETIVIVFPKPVSSYPQN